MGRQDYVRNNVSMNFVATAVQNGQQGCLFSAEGNVYTTAKGFTLPAAAIGFRLYPTTNDIRFSIDETTGTVGSIDGGTRGIGGIAKAGEWTERYVDTGSAHIVYVLGTTTTNVAAEAF